MRHDVRIAHLVVAEHVAGAVVRVDGIARVAVVDVRLDVDGVGRAELERALPRGIGIAHDQHPPQAIEGVVVDEPVGVARSKDGSVCLLDGEVIVIDSPALVGARYGDEHGVGGLVG
jgi:hypothetical protein